ncbi:MAG: hypothetical protein ACR2FY_14825 [Pirellulaceae bacterium]
MPWPIPSASASAPSRARPGRARFGNQKLSPSISPATDGLAPPEQCLWQTSLHPDKPGGGEGVKVA